MPCIHRNGNCSGFIHYLILTHKAKNQHLFTQTGKSKPNLINLTSHSCRNCLPVPAEEADQPLINAFPRARWIQFFLTLTTKASDPTFHYFLFFFFYASHKSFVFYFCTRIIHKDGFTYQERMEFRPVIYSNTVQSILSIVKAMTKLGISYENPARMVSMTPFLLKWASEYKFL